MTTRRRSPTPARWPRRSRTARPATTTNTACDEESELDASSLTFGSAPGEVEVISAAEREYEIRATGRNGHEFRGARDASGTVQRTCTPVGKGGCSSAGTW